MKKIVFGLLFVSLFSQIGFAQKTVKEWSEMEDKKFTKKLLISKGTGLIGRMIKDPSQLPKFDTIGILGFSIIQPTYSDKNPHSIVTPYLTSTGATFFVDAFFNDAKPEMSSRYTNQNTTLLTPSEYLDSQEKKDLYNSTEFEHSKLWKAVGKMSNSIRGGRVDDIKGSPEGYKYLVVVSADAKMWRAIGKFSGDLGLDAVLVVETTLGYNGKQLILQKIEMALIGPNTVPYSEKDKKKYAPFGPVKGYLEGINYGYLQINPPKGGILLATMKKGKIIDSHLEDIGVIYGRIADILLKNTKEEFKALSDKKFK
mgnify:CR=1 FL=1